MRSLFQNKRWILFISILAMGALTVLAIGLRDVSFREAEHFAREEAEQAETVAPRLAQPPPEISLNSQLVVWAAIFLLVLLIGILLSPEMRKRMFRLFFRVAFTYWALYFVFSRYGDVIASFGQGLAAPAANAPANGAGDLQPAVFEPPQESPWLSYFVAVTLVLLAAILAWKGMRYWRAYRGGGDGQSLDELARVARASLRDLSSGRDSTDVIMNCYFRMSDVVADKRHLQRGAAMTPAEFSLRLERAGLPGEAVKRLTRLFENVRYGGHRSGPVEVNEAVACLTTILHYCGETV